MEMLPQRNEEAHDLGLDEHAPWIEIRRKMRKRVREQRGGTEEGGPWKRGREYEREYI
jgi:hypothetical protein